MGGIEECPTSAAKDYINSIPFDILLRIVLSLDPPDILQLRRTCAKLYSHTKEKITWIRALRLTCLRHGVVYPLHVEKTSSTEELEHAVMCHYKFAARLHAEARSGSTNMKLKPLKIRKLQPLDGTHIIDGNPSKGFRALALIPGGRFLVTIGFGFSLQLWDITAPDLDHHALKAEIGIPLCEDQSDILHLDVKAGAVCKNGTEKIVVLVVVRVLSDCFTGLYLLYSVEPKSDVTQFKEVGRLSFQDEFADTNSEIGGTNVEHLLAQRSYLLMSGYSIRHECDLVWTWNYEEDILSTLKLPPRATSDRNSYVKEITLLNDHVVVWSHDLIESYKLPPFYPRSGRPMEATDPRARLSRTVLDNNLHHLIARSIPYHDPIDDLLIFHLFGPESEETLEACYFHCYTLSFPHANDTPLVKGLQTSHSSWSSHHFRAANCDLPPYPISRTLFRSYKLPYHEQALMWIDSQCKKLSFKVLDNDGREADIEILSRSSRRRSGFRFDYTMDKASISFCPFSGRLCYIGISKEFDEELGGSMIYVVDYV